MRDIISITKSLKQKESNGKIYSNLHENNVPAIRRLLPTSLPHQFNIPDICYEIVSLFITYHLGKPAVLIKARRHAYKLDGVTFEHEAHRMNRAYKTILCKDRHNRSLFIILWGDDDCKWNLTSSSSFEVMHWTKCTTAQPLVHTLPRVHIGMDKHQFTQVVILHKVPVAVFRYDKTQYMLVDQDGTIVSRVGKNKFKLSHNSQIYCVSDNGGESWTALRRVYIAHQTCSTLRGWHDLNHHVLAHAFE